MRQSRLHRIVWLVAVWMLLGIGTAQAASQVSAPAAWRNTPTLSSDICPGYQFHSTSSMTPVVGTTSYTTAVYTPGAGPARAKKDEWGWGTEDPDGPGIGEVDPAQPVGEPLILLLFGALMILVIYKKKRATS